MPEASHFIEHGIVSTADVQAQMRHWFPKSVSVKKRTLLLGNRNINLRMTLLTPTLKDMLKKSVFLLAAILDSYFRNLDAQCKSLEDKRGASFCS